MKGLEDRLDEAEERSSALEDKLLTKKKKIKKGKLEKLKIVLETYQILPADRTYISWDFLPLQRERIQWNESRNLPNLEKYRHLQVQEAPRTPNARDQRELHHDTLWSNFQRENTEHILRCT